MALKKEYLISQNPDSDKTYRNYIKMGGYIRYSNEPKPSIGFGGYGQMPIVWDENINDGRTEKEIIRNLVGGLVNLIKWHHGRHIVA